MALHYILRFYSKICFIFFFALFLRCWKTSSQKSSVLPAKLCFSLDRVIKIVLIFFTINHRINFCRKSENGVCFFSVMKFQNSLKNFNKVISSVSCSKYSNEIRRKFHLDLRKKCLNDFFQKYLYEIVKNYSTDYQSPSEDRNCLSVFLWKFCDFFNNNSIWNVSRNCSGQLNITPEILKRCALDFFEENFPEVYIF